MNMNIEIVVVIVLQSESHTMSSRNSLLMPRCMACGPPPAPSSPTAFLSWSVSVALR